jgi:hypothetical protein
VVGQERFIALVAFLFGCAVLLMAGASGVLAESPPRGREAPPSAPCT